MDKNQGTNIWLESEKLKLEGPNLKSFQISLKLAIAVIFDV